ncbi:uncharacterized protein GGS22DRAFT_200275 [Annulohypoxylon maeteangense]|uniref:uncharacterized protein n=1 Tax=Annulohypoxylon maeteangense TaxID=1927788 RepID=UPI00200847B8|nr:uncharacterized protein GGS22DRAFT_200275 [Annulohypoxylon maeteangense]KAI0885372.1 hypothetical protein GGS22DRAFT_200275 [Annulohypoxylon maeteangense]
MPHATKTKKQTRPRVNTAISAPVSYPVRPQQQNQVSASSSSSSSQSYTWTAADAAKASRDGAFLTAWPPEETYYAPPVHLFGQNYQAQRQAQGQVQDSQHHYSSTYRPPTTLNQGASTGGK